ncbi:hypothetical protein DN062_02615 [Nitrincola tibetensis]|uniref:Ketosynthase family 3 (KS3) domain-containing protein n=1 Tax=Nitrincola tibetensis TaxID=2219697 RepID=A0A364NPZ8_9GAMM|nr:beta-ketoacyl synthase N-terminal-like domain-containing protein [Nitrincola tibetensis]RAU19179.1 hypothetical protein DN062_02615 [Nitrincola tibetensis]
MPYFVPLAIIDYECATALGLTLQDTWQAASTGKSGIVPLTRYDPDLSLLPSADSVRFAGQIPASFETLAGSSAVLERTPDPTAQVLRSVCHRLLQRINPLGSVLNPTRVAVIGGTALTSTITHEAMCGRQQPLMTGLLSRCQNVPLAMVAADWGFTGPQFNVGGACASSGQALLIAGQLLQAGIIDAALVCGFELPLQASNAAGFAWLKAAAVPPQKAEAIDPATLSRPLSADRCGLVMAEGVSALWLTTAALAKNNAWTIKGWLQGGAMNSSARSQTALDEMQVAACMRDALIHSSYSTHDIGIISTHATGTWQGDQVEIKALETVFGEHLKSSPITANKSQLGHSMGAAALISTILALEGMRHSLVLPTLNFNQDKALPIILASQQPLNYVHNTVLVNAFGFGGTHVSLVVSRGE